MFCNKCGTKLKKNSNFCHVCGNKVSEIEIYIRKSDEPIPDQISMGDMFEKPKFKKLEQRDSGFLDILRSFRIKDDKPHTPLEGDNEVALKFNKKVEIKSEEEIKLDSKEDKPIISQKSKTKSKDFKEFDIPKFQVGKDTESEKLEFKEEDLLLPIEDIPIKQASIFKRFFDFMREEEVYDKEILSKSSPKDSADEQIIIESHDKEINDKLIFDSKDIHEPIEISVKDIEQTPFKSEAENTLEKLDEEKKPSLLDKIKLFLKEEDEDNLLDLSPEEYTDLVYGQGKIEDTKVDPILNVDEPDEIIEEPLEDVTKITFADKLASFFNSNKKENPEKDPDSELESHKKIEIEDLTVEEEIENKSRFKTDSKEFKDFEIPQFEKKKTDEIDTVTDVKSKELEDSDEVTNEKKSGFFDSLKSFFIGNKKEEDSAEELEDYTEEIPTKEETPSYTSEKSTYSYLDTEKTIRYSKTVIDSYLSKADSGELNVEDFDKIDDFKIEEESKKDDFREFINIVEPEDNIVESPVEFEIEKDFIGKVDEIEFDDSWYEEEPIKKSDDSIYEELVLDKPKKSSEDYVYERREEKEVISKEKTPGVFSNIAEFFKSIPLFFFANSNDKKEKKEKDNIDIILSSPVSSQDTMPLILSSEEKEILNKEIDRRQRGSRQEEALKRTNVKVAPVIRKMINLGAKLIIPIFLLVLAGACWTISWVISNPVFIGILGLIKFSILYITISVATNSAFNSIGLRLKRSVVSLFIFLQMFVYQVLDAIYIKLTFIEGQSIESLLHVLSPKIITIIFFILLSFLLLIFNYKKVKERKGTLVFIGWYIVISTTITLVVILLELLISTILFSLFKDILFI